MQVKLMCDEQTLGWAKYSHEQYGLPGWGASGPYKKVYEKFGITGSSTSFTSVSTMPFGCADNRVRRHCQDQQEGHHILQAEGRRGRFAARQGLLRTEHSAAHRFRSRIRSKGVIKIARSLYACIFQYRRHLTANI